jgi:hypothetical protein
MRILTKNSSFNLTVQQLYNAFSLTLQYVPEHQTLGSRLDREFTILQPVTYFMNTSDFWLLLSIEPNHWR